ncbi:MAG TPA: hypothetical protein VE085_01355 [Burkholderiales bacterium]|nr:hypothetical protein [Burkholderiales bacterium]
MTLPYEFDTTGVVKVILRGVLGLLALVILPGIFYSLFVSHSTAAAVQLLLIGGVVAIFGRVFFRNLIGSQGTITPDAVVVQPSTLYGIRLAGPAGTFPMQQFEAVRVERIFGPLRTAQAPRWHERVSLKGKGGAPDILIARTALNAGVPLGHELAMVLSLPYVEEVAPA